MSDLLETELPLIPGARSCRPVYREDEANHCPGCGRSQWLIGRFSSECAFCATVLPLQEGSTREAYNHQEKPVFITRGPYAPR
jgi:hypothetical protein